MKKMKKMIYEYIFTAGADYRIEGVNESHDVENRILKIEKEDGEILTFRPVDSFKKNPKVTL